MRTSIYSFGSKGRLQIFAAFAARSAAAYVALRAVWVTPGVVIPQRLLNCLNRIICAYTKTSNAAPSFIRVPRKLSVPVIYNALHARLLYTRFIRALTIYNALHERLECLEKLEHLFYTRFTQESWVPGETRETHKVRIDKIQVQNPYRK